MTRGTETFADRITQVAQEADFGRAWARKSGRNADWPYVPVVVLQTSRGPQQQQVMGLAYAERSEAVAAAERHIEALRRSLAKKLADPRHRALREQYGLPRDLPLDDEGVQG